MSKFKLNDKAGKQDYIFIGGNTKYLADCTPEELAVLHENGDPRVSAEPGQDGAVAVSEPIGEEVAPKKGK